MADFLSNLSARQTLLDYSVGNFNQKRNMIAPFMAPDVRVPVLSGIYKYWNDKAGFQYLNTERALGGQATTVEFTATDNNYTLVPNALQVPIDDAILKDADDNTSRLIYQAYLDMAVSTAVTSYEGSVMSVISASCASGQTPYQSGLGANWSLASGSLSGGLPSNPLADIESGSYAIAASIGQAPNRIVMGSDAWRWLKTSFTAKGLVSADKFNDSTIKEYFRGVMEGMDIKVSYLGQSNNMGQSARTITPFVDKKDVYIFYANDNPTTLDRSAFKTLTFVNTFDNIQQYYSNERSSTMLKLFWYIKPVLANPYAVVRFRVT